MVAKATYPMSSPLKLQTLSQNSLGNKLKTAPYWTRILSQCELWIYSCRHRQAQLVMHDGITSPFCPVSLETASASLLC